MVEADLHARRAASSGLYSGRELQYCSQKSTDQGVERLQKIALSIFMNRSDKDTNADLPKHSFGCCENVSVSREEDRSDPWKRCQ